ncbi:DUF3006 domain-containing protein [Viridibacillus sp. FSL R5-0477]|uniref:Uncharacterized protein n=1 Tax=Viridibacillus arenosi FSL R5-213 TaxID=1227360 RepID=W4EN23_9BACL|nr:MULTISPECIES: DUF3006 domain-containing protein [Viridibacillus]ETT81196.1 hypothetical protein C176_20859 [Viridibacillus arenosi FSL R5-213]OMC84138.1 pyruvate kinase [Viridibacillus sp. FSL H8-0123]OMC88661.1 pyruvate kinase [Viridibacillus sp. FSL H7-0596]OMC93294.1 pyruvate kinase [Viridibacillus arenosi]
MKRGIIDRFEGDIAVVEFENSLEDFSLTQLPKGVQAGDVLLFENGEITIDSEGKEQLGKEVADLMEELFED